MTSTKLESRECYSFTDGVRIMPAAIAKKGLVKLQILHPVFLLKSQAERYKKLVWGDQFIKIIKVKVIEV